MGRTKDLLIMEGYGEGLPPHLNDEPMNTLQETAQRLDQLNGLTDEQQTEKMAQLKDWRRRVAKLNAAMVKTELNPPTERDFKILELTENLFKKSKNG